MSWFTSIFASQKNIDNVLNKENGLLTQVGGWVGNFNFTNEEKAELNAQLIESCSHFVKMTLGESTLRSKARRSLALLWVRAHLASILAVMVIAKFDMVLAQFYFTIVLSPFMVSGTLAILAFFFGSHMLSSHIGLGKKLDK